jgi:hypothetical protein
MHPDVLQIVADKLTELVQKELGYPVHFLWPEEIVEQGSKMTLLVSIDRPLSKIEHRKLEAWCEKTLGAEWPRMTIWDHIRDDD